MPSSVGPFLRVSRICSPGFALLLFGTVLMAALLLARGGAPEVPTGRWPEQLESTSESQVAEQLAQLEELGDVGIPYLVAALQSDSPTVSRTAERALRDALRRWRLLPVNQSRTRLVLLMRNLQERYDRLPPAGQRAAVDLADRVADWAYEEQYADLKVLSEAFQAQRHAAVSPPATLGVAARDEWSLEHLPEAVTAIPSPPRPIRP